MIMKLELKHLAPYLPYDVALNCIDSEYMESDTGILVRLDDEFCLIKDAEDETWQKEYPCAETRSMFL